MSDIKRNILVTGGGGDIGQSVIKCLKKETKDRVIACDIDYFAAGKAFCDVFYVAPLVSEEQRYIDFIHFLISKEQLTHIIPITEYEIKLFSDVSIRDSFKHVKVLINDPFIVNTFLDKFKTISFFQQNNIPYPKTKELSDFNDVDFKYPMIIKEKSSRGGKGVYIVNSHEELEHHIQNIKEGIVQEFIGSEKEEYTMAVFSDGNNISHIAFRRMLGYGSLSKFVEIVNHENIEKLAIDIARKCNLKGCINVQMRKHNDTYIPFEINPRISSTVAFRNHFGFKDVVWWLDLLDNNAFELIYMHMYSKGVGVRVVEEVYFDLEYCENTQ